MKFLLLVLVVISVIYSPWFKFSNTLSSGDWPYLFIQNIQEFKIPAESPFLWLDPYYQITAKLGVQVFLMSWEMTEKIFWFLPFLAISLISSYLFLKYISKQFGIEDNKSKIFISLGCLIFITNTYILMLSGGGQMGVVMAYSLIPAVILILFKIIQSPKLNPSIPLRARVKSLIAGSLILGAQLMFDPRIFLLSLFIVFLYILFTLKNFSLSILKRLIFVLILAMVLNLFWILPNLNFLNMSYDSSAKAVDARFLSFATFSNSISLLHPNWPENIFGKIGFMKPEFLALPILAYASLFSLTMKQLNSRTILFFTFLGLFGAFFAKGINPPFGELYVWLSNVPGFSIFRDPTKFYVLTVVSYMVLIPFCIYKLSEKVSSIKYYALSIVFLVFWVFLIRHALLGNLTGTFKPHAVPQEYVSLKDFLIEKKLGKTFWVPNIERFGLNSKTFPAISAIEFFKVSSVSGVLSKFNEAEIKKQLADERVRYVVVPDDVLSEIFITDRKYDERLYVATVGELKNITWLSEVKNSGFGKIKVFEMINSR